MMNSLNARLNTGGRLHRKNRRRVRAVVRTLEGMSPLSQAARESSIELLREVLKTEPEYGYKVEDENDYT